MLVRGVCDFQVLQDYGAVAIHLHQVLVVIFNCAQQRQFVVGTLAYYMGKNGELVSVCTRSFHENEMRGFQMFCLYFTQSLSSFHLPQDHNKVNSFQISCTINTAYQERPSPGAPVVFFSNPLSKKEHSVSSPLSIGPNSLLH